MKRMPFTAAPAKKGKFPAERARHLDDQQTWRPVTGSEIAEVFGVTLRV
jgi:hypothetical protein